MIISGRAICLQLPFIDDHQLALYGVQLIEYIPHIYMDWLAHSNLHDRLLLLLLMVMLLFPGNKARPFSNFAPGTVALRQMPIDELPKMDTLFHN